jgi:hypothetical protein|tara:strand:+ start:58 stop:279 length:222 start_codon:yes stop_codon:yes gene_type:complete
MVKLIHRESIMKINEIQKQKLKEAGLWEGFFDSLKKSIKKLTDRDIQKIANKGNKEMANFLKDFKSDPEKYGY